MKYANVKNDFHYSHDRVMIRDVVDTNKKWIQQTKITYEFFNHFHPYVGKLIEQLNKESLAGLFDVDFQSECEEDFFGDEYGPNTDDHTLVVKEPYPIKEIDLSEDGAYSVYNWEFLFHAPLTIAVHLSKNQRFAEAQRWFHLIFDPTSNDTSVKPPMRFWKFREFRENSDVELINELLMSLSKSEDGELSNLGKQILKNIERWRDKPFQPHVVARNRFIAYRFNVVMKYLDNLIAWGDSLFRQDTIETINEATQIYVLAANILGPKPQKVPRMGITQPKTYAGLKNTLDAFGNALVDLEGQFPFNLSNPSTRHSATSQTNTLFGIARTLYFCIPQNDNLLGYWDTVADRLFKIRYCMNIEGIVRQLPLFEPPIDPGMLVKAAAAGIDISSVVSGLNQPISQVRAPLLIQKALEICSEVKTLGNALLSALEKEEAEEFALLRQGHEITILKQVEDVKYLQWKEAEAATAALLKTREVTYQRYRHYQLILGKKEEDLKEIKDISIERKELNEDNFDEVYNELVGKYGSEMELETYPQKEQQGDSSPSNQSGATSQGVLNLNPNEYADLNVHLPKARKKQKSASTMANLSSTMAMLPNFGKSLQPLGEGATISFGGSQLAAWLQIEVNSLKTEAEEETYLAASASKLSSYERRTENWILESNLAASELMHIGRQIISALIREQIVKIEYENHKQQIKHAQEIDTFLKEKFTNQELYTWMQGEIYKTYYECYKFAFDIAKKAEQTMKHELMRKELADMNFIKFNYWDSGRKGLLSGEALYLDLKRMEMAYHDHNKREYEMTKHVSLQQLNPNALLQLKATGSCEITIPEWLFDMDGPGHYMRRIKTVSISIPCVTGPYTSVNCTLSLLKSTVRQSSLLKDGAYGRDLEGEDDRFKDYFGAIQSIVTSSGQNDSGLFETNLRDERYLPFEGAGAESRWKLELPSDSKDELPLPRMFDYNTISDVILHLRYTAREGGNLLRNGAVTNLETRIEEAQAAGSVRLFSMRHEFPTEWAKFKSNKIEGDTKTSSLMLELRQEHFPFWSQDRLKAVKRVDFFAKNGKDPMKITENADGTGEADTLIQDNLFGKLWRGQLTHIPEIDQSAPLSINFNLNFTDNSMEDLWLALTWGK